MTTDADLWTSTDRPTSARTGTAPGPACRAGCAAPSSGLGRRPPSAVAGRGSASGALGTGLDCRRARGQRHVHHAPARRSLDGQRLVGARRRTSLSAAAAARPTPRRAGPEMTTASTVEWELWSTRARLVVTNPGVLGAARELVDSYLAEVDDAANRFRERQRDQPAGRALRLGDPVADADPPDRRGAGRRRAHRRRRRPDGRRRAAAPRLRPRPAAGHRRRPARCARSSGRCPGYRSLRARRAPGCGCPPGSSWTSAPPPRRSPPTGPPRSCTAAFGTGVLVSLGGDIATAGAAPAAGWQVHVQDRDEDPWTQVALPGRRRDRDLQHRLAAVARGAAARCTTSSTPAPASRPDRSGAASPSPPTPALHANAVTTAVPRPR